MTVVFAVLLGAGAVLCAAAIAWAVRTRHARQLWRRTHHDLPKVALVLELEERLHEIEHESQRTSATR
ncbi:MAG TPA: hypothetical protein VL856_18990 [Acidimicrobiia bacterium]|nr:hypothetical protein [Acidimicrobiia bacterium]